MLRAYWLTFIFIISQPDFSWAFQPHAAPEGHYVHQMAHILFMGALIYLYWHIGRVTSFVSKGWRYLRAFCLLFLLWNILTFTGHAAAVHVHSEDIILQAGSWNSYLLPPYHTAKILFYFARLDHLLSVPAMFFLYISLKTFYAEAMEGEEK
jgi:hypothetical protein